jgi:hypothetical protein
VPLTPGTEPKPDRGLRCFRPAERHLPRLDCQAEEDIDPYLGLVALSRRDSLIVDSHHLPAAGRDAVVGDIHIPVIIECQAIRLG